MAFQKGQQLWKLRKTHGTKRKYQTAELLWEGCTEYFQWVEDNPIIEKKVTQYQGVQVDMEVEKPRPMLLEGLMVHLGITDQTWYNYKKLGGDFLEVIELADRVMKEQKLSGAMADQFNTNIIARYMGLKDKPDAQDEEPKPLTINYTVVDARKDDDAKS